MFSEDLAYGKWASNRISEVLTGISKLQDMSDPWLFGTPITMSPSILSGSLIHDSLEINPPEPLTDALLGFHQHLDWCTKGQADEEKTKVNKIKMVSERLANSVWSPLEKSPSVPSLIISITTCHWFWWSVCCYLLHRNGISWKARNSFCCRWIPNSWGSVWHKISAQYIVVEWMNESTYPHIFGVGSANAVLYSQSLSKNAVNHTQRWWDMSLK